MKNHAAELKKLAQAISSAQHVLLATHENPDEDGLGAMLAFASYFEDIKKPYTAYIIGTPPERLSFLPCFDTLAAVPPENPDLLIAFDYGVFERLKLASLPPVIATIDHHPQETQKGAINITDPDYSSSCEIAYRFFTANGIAVTAPMATALYTGIVADTGGFIHANTSAEAFRAAAELKALGADTERIAKRVLGLASANAARAIGLAFSRLAIDNESKVMYSYLSSEELAKMGTNWDEIGVLVNTMNHVHAPEVRCVILFKDKGDGMISVSFRSDPEKRYDARALAHIFGGGGHQYAAAAKIHGTLEAVMQKVLAAAGK